MPRKRKIAPLGRIEKAALSILHMWKEDNDEAKKRNDDWWQQGKRQGYHDALNAMIHAGLITDFNVVECTVTLADDL